MVAVLIVSQIWPPWEFGVPSAAIIITALVRDRNHDRILMAIKPCCYNVRETQSS